MTFRSGKRVLALAMAAGLALSGCATDRGHYGGEGYGYQGGGYDTHRCASCGVVQDVQQVYAQDNGHGTLGAVIGAVAGGVLGNQVGEGKGREAATVAGAVAGGVIGNQVGKRSGRDEVAAWRITVRLDDGQYATVTQREAPQLRVGDYVEVRGDHVYVR